MNITILGCGRWASFLAWYFDRNGHNVKVWGRSGSKNYEMLANERQNEYLHLPDKIAFTNSLDEALAFSDRIIISISAQGLRDLMGQIQTRAYQGKTFILCMKGLEETTGKRLSQVVKEYLDVKVAVWVGPGHVQDFIKGVPNCMVIDSEDPELTKTIVNDFGSDLIRFYYGVDMIGNEVGAATKNVIGLAAGMLDGFGYTSLKGALMARGTREISRLIKAMGGDSLTVYGLCHLGDYEATLFSPHSNNRRFGEMFVKGEIFDHLAEGVSTLKAVKLLSEQYGVELSINEAVHSIIINGKPPKEVLANLFLRSIKSEF